MVLDGMAILDRVDIASAIAYSTKDFDTNNVLEIDHAPGSEFTAFLDHMNNPAGIAP